MFLSYTNQFKLNILSFDGRLIIFHTEIKTES